MEEALRDRESWDGGPEMGKEQQEPEPSTPVREMTIGGGGMVNRTAPTEPHIQR